MDRPQPRALEGRIETLDALRGIAALAVAWFHFSSSQGLNNNLVRLSGAYGWVGVHIFFVISAFVVPLALYRANYNLQYYGRFLLKRIIRLEPPYIVSIGFIIALGYLAPLMPGYRGEAYSVSALQVFFHLGYINVFMGYPWLNIVFWSLAIEFQFYIAVGLMFPLLVTRRAAARWSTLAMLALLAFLLPSPDFIFHYLFLFVLGILTFQRHVGLLRMSHYWVGFMLAVAGIMLTLGAVVAIAGATTALVIAFVPFRNRVLKFFGNISYSLYLIHFPIGLRAINLGFRFVENGAGRITVLLLTLGLSTAAAYVLYRLVEKPAQAWSSSIKFGERLRDKAAEKLIDQQAL